MTSSQKALEQLERWKVESTKLYLSCVSGGFRCWCAGELKHAASAELHFGIEGIDGKDLLLVMVTSAAKFKFVDNRDVWHFFAPQRRQSDFGKVLQIDLQPGARIYLAEVFDRAIEVISQQGDTQLPLT